MSGLFGTLNIAKSGIFANQRAIDVTTHNVDNANTDGYSRQRAEMQTNRPFCTPSMDNAAGPGQMGTGVHVSQIARIRDTFLDYQIRVEKGINGQYEGRDKFLREIENVMNGLDETGFATLIGKFFDSWQQLSKQPETSNARTVVAQQSKALADELNHMYSQLEKLKTNSQDLIKQTTIDVNSLLHQISDLNKEIIQVKVAGDNPNDLMDRRDLLLDELSIKFGINVEKKDLFGICVNTKDDPNSNVPMKDGKPVNLVQNEHPEQSVTLSYISKIEPRKDDPEKYDITYYKKGNMNSPKDKVVIEGVKLTDEQYRQIDECRVLWTDHDGNLLNSNGESLGEPNEGKYTGRTFSGVPGKENDIMIFTPSSGEFKGYMSVQQDIDEEIDQINRLAKAIVFSVNTIHSQSNESGNDNMPFFVNFDIATYENNILQNKENVLNSEKDITAANISVNKEILEDVMKIKAAKEDVPPAGESDGNRALAIANIRDRLMEIQNIDKNTTRENFLKNEYFAEDKTLGIKNIKNYLGGMNIDNYFRDIVNTLAVKEQQAKRVVKNQFQLLKSLQQSRDSVSGVSLDEETANLIQFQHAYQASAKIVATVDELLDVVINGLKR
ncbi:flagellar hook-associated protein 1 [Clostridium acetireducens DSM 10703]|uniref:Flagellar hook-associated protein 1 n=1 Tax=Clostridium acetireducens DSM 10703 TaxID=1121290 RepID=A0A1E8EZB8_9CLOT|nr:flagellar hook-associated protein FlgK [Clostridium acetireducens]OFI06510.1 flagellar hook-associated protein 1 [Clostridium acetireducens DSM 10703]